MGMLIEYLLLNNPDKTSLENTNVVEIKEDRDKP